MTPWRIVGEIEAPAASTDLSIRRIHERIGGKASRGVVGGIAKRARAARKLGPAHRVSEQQRHPVSAG